LIGWKNAGRRKVAEGLVSDFLSILKQSYMKSNCDLSLSVHKTEKRLPLSETISLDRLPIAKGDIWGKNWSSGYFYIYTRIPEDFKGKKLALKLNLGGEVLLYDRCCKPLFGLTNCSVHKDSYFKDLYCLGSYDKDVFEVYAEVASNDLFGLKRNEKKVSRSIENPHGTWQSKVEYAYVGVFDEDVWNLSIAVEYLFSLYLSMDFYETRAVRVLSALFDAATVFPIEGAKSAYSKLEEVIKSPANYSSVQNVVVGHAHIDTAWLWPIAETHRKVARTFSSQVSNISKYPEYRFVASSPLQYKWVKDEYPLLFGDVKKCIQDKKWEPVGAMWVEPDCVITSGEALVRQILEGKRFYKKEFGIEIKNSWLPDCFGFSASLPQILKKSGVDYFVTQKISWNAHTEFPYTTFIWRGIDNSSVIAHFLPEKTYNSDGYPSDYRKAERCFWEKDRLDKFVTALGIGDGGGGPKYEHIEMTLLAKDSENVPKSSFGDVSGFFDYLEKNKDLLETYKGELYLELHRGTATSQARIKRNNCLFEEGLCAIEAILLNEDYSKEKLMEIVQDGLMLQFHDILPGSCINEVYKEADSIYQSIFDRYLGLLSDYVLRKYSSYYVISTKFGITRSRGKCDALSIFSAQRKKRLSLVEINGLEHDSYLLGSEYHLVKLGKSYYGFVPLSQGWTGFDLEESLMQKNDIDSLTLSNENICYLFNERGQIISARDQFGNEFIDSSFGNDLKLYKDQPHCWEAWDIDYYYPEMEIGGFDSVSHEKITQSIIKFEYKSRNSSLIQYAYISPDGYELYFINTVDWNEERVLLRVEFPTRDLDYGTSAIAFGNVKRKTHIQNEEDFAKFEFPAQGYVDVSDEQGGAAVISDVKYGFSLYGQKIGLSLLRSPIDPDPYADLGAHKFIYCYAPHLGDFANSSVKEISEGLKSVNVTVVSGEQIVERIPAFIEGDGISFSSIKQKIDGDGIALRCYEYLGKNSKAKLICDETLGFKLASLDEREVDSRIYYNGDMLEFGAFEIKTLISVV